MTTPNQSLGQIAAEKIAEIAPIFTTQQTSISKIIDDLRDERLELAEGERDGLLKRIETLEREKAEIENRAALFLTQKHDAQDSLSLQFAMNGKLEYELSTLRASRDELEKKLADRPKVKPIDPNTPLPRLPWVASNQYGMHFILSQDNEILMRADWMPMEILKAMADAASAKLNHG